MPQKWRNWYEPRSVEKIHTKSTIFGWLTVRRAKALDGSQIFPKVRTLSFVDSFEDPSQPAPKTLLVLGSTGKLGRLMQAKLKVFPEVAGGARVLWAARKQTAGVSVVIEPPPSELHNVPRADAVLALWGVVPGRGDLSDNVALAEQAVQIAKSCGARRVIHCSSSAVYGPGIACSETAPLAPINAYGVSKIEMERWIFSPAQASEDMPQSCAMRLANVIGADSLFAAMSTGDPVTLDGFDIGVSPQRSYASVGLIWRTVCALLTIEELPKIINVAASSPFPMHKILEAAGHPFVWRPAPPTAVRNVSLDVSKLEALLGHKVAATADDMVTDWQALTLGGGT